MSNNSSNSSTTKINDGFGLPPKSIKQEPKPPKEKK
jgi:hypothetical protein